MLSLKSIINNIAKGQSAVATRLILQALEQNYQGLRGAIQLNGVYVKDNKPMIFTLMPSSRASIYYDIVIQLQDKNKITLNSPFKIYSNSPGFAYNFAYVFNKNGSLLFPQHYPSEFLSLPPKTRNPFESIGFDKHCYAILRFVTETKIETFLEKEQEKMPQVKNFNEVVRLIGQKDEELRELKKQRQNK